MPLDLANLGRFIGEPPRQAVDLILTDGIEYVIRDRSSSTHLFGTRDPEAFTQKAGRLKPGRYTVLLRSRGNRRVVHSHRLTITESRGTPETLEDRVARLEQTLAVVVGVLISQQQEEPTGA